MSLTRFSFTLPVVFLVILLSTVEARPQQAGSAGATRPNLRVLQALPEAQLFPLMNLVADSLGVRCDYCHVQAKPDFTKTPSNAGGWVWSSDDKPQKRTARDMMRMVVDLNAKSFAGAARITCYTCHRGATDPARLPPIPPPGGSATTPASLTLPPVDRVWNTYVSAVGKIESPTRGTGTIISGWDDRPEGRYGKVEVVVSGTDRYRVTLTTSTGTISQGFDGDAAWVATNNVVQRVSGDDAARLRRVAARYRPTKDRPANLEIVGLARVGGRDAYVARAKIDATTTLAMYFDVVTGLLRRELTTTETMLLPLEEQVDYDDYRDIGGVQLPFRIETSDGAPYGLVTRTFLEIRRNVAVDDALFRPPGGSRARLK
jgi:hypothetical protein